MTFTIELPADAEAKLTQKAKAAGVDVPTLVERVLQAEACRPSLEEMLKPVHEAFEQSGMGEDELSELLVKAKKQMRAERKR
jgi:hypothetical protein